jgi:hypothetical protein
MTREQIAGFLMGISVGTAIGFFLKPFESDDRKLTFSSRIDAAREAAQMHPRGIDSERPSLARNQPA